MKMDYKSVDAKLLHKENSSRLENAMMAAKMAWWELDLPTGNVSFHKRKAEMLGYPKEKFNHYKDFMALVHPEDYDKAMNAMQLHIDGKSDKYEVEYRILTKSGNYEWFYDIGSIEKKDLNGIPLKITGLVINITERKKVETALKKRYMELNCLYSILALTELPDITFEKILNNAVMLLPLSWQYPEITEARIVLEEQSFQTAGFQETSWMLVSKIIVNGKSVGKVEICYLKEKQVCYEGPFIKEELHLLDAIAKQIGLIAERNKTAEILKKSEVQLKELVTTKDKFFNIVAHDLKNPFTSLLGASELLFENIDQISHENIKDLAMILNVSAKGGYSILQNLLDWSRSQTGLLKISPNKINLKDIIEQNISNLQLTATNKEIKILSEVNEDLFVNTDKDMINTILRNILSNALKYTYKSGKVIVSSTMTTNEVIVSVKDNGIGIPEDRIETLFFIDVKNSMPGTEKEQGTGLGLKLCKEFVEKLGGRIWVENKNSEGSEFKFTIPLKNITS